VSTASSGEEGIAKAKAEHPDLILMDVVMPGMNGFQATRQIATDPATNTIPIIIVSTKDQETDKMWGLRQGAKDYITKPAKEKELVNKINGILGAA
jgi:twitching motility two-component system response regulator PilH